MVGPYPSGSSLAYRIKAGDILAYSLFSALTTLNSTYSVRGIARAIYDDGTQDIFSFQAESTVGTPGTNGGGGGTFVATYPGDHPIAKDGWLVEWYFGGPANAPNNSIWIEGYIGSTSTGTVGGALAWQLVLRGPVTPMAESTLGTFDPVGRDNWPILLVQGTVLEDNTVGTHVCSLTLTPRAGGAMEFLYGQIILTGAAALSTSAYIDDGAGNVLGTLFNASAAGTYGFPNSASTTNAFLTGGIPFLISGVMRLILSTATSTVSDTQTFACALRFRPNLVPKATFADNTGSPTITINTYTVF